MKFDDALLGDSVLIRLPGIGNRSGLFVSGLSPQLTLATLQAATAHSYYADPVSGDLWVKFVATEKRKDATVRWVF
jgi:hypothetical protein